jgi:hypothetical protein
LICSVSGRHRQNVRLTISAGCSNDEKDYMVRQLRHRRDGSAIDAKP